MCFIVFGHAIGPEQDKVVNVYAGLSNNEIIEVQREDGVHRIVIRQGREDKVGTKHSVLHHYDTGVGYITAEDILLIPEIVALGKKEQGKRGETTTTEYSITDSEGVKYTVVTEYADRREVFDNFYTNRKTPLDARKTRSEEARDDSSSAYIGDKDTTSNAKIQVNEQKFSLITPEMDADYLDAVERGDMTTAQRMVMEAAKLAMPNTKVVDENGDPKVVCHGTPNYFNAFSKEMFGTSTDRGIRGNGFYFSEDAGYAKQYQKRNSADSYVTGAHITEETIHTYMKRGHQVQRLIFERKRTLNKKELLNHLEQFFVFIRSCSRYLQAL